MARRSDLTDQRDRQTEKQTDRQSQRQKIIDSWTRRGVNKLLRSQCYYRKAAGPLYNVKRCEKEWNVYNHTTFWLTSGGSFIPGTRSQMPRNGAEHITEVTVRRAGLVLRWVTLGCYTSLRSWYLTNPGNPSNPGNAGQLGSVILPRVRAVTTDSGNKYNQFW